MPLQLEPGPEAGFRSALDPGAPSRDGVVRLIKDEAGLHCGATLGTCRFAVFHSATSDCIPPAGARPQAEAQLQASAQYAARLLECTSISPGAQPRPLRGSRACQ